MLQHKLFVSLMSFIPKALKILFYWTYFSKSSHHYWLDSLHWVVVPEKFCQSIDNRNSGESQVPRIFFVSEGGSFPTGHRTSAATLRNGSNNLLFYSLHVKIIKNSFKRCAIVEKKKCHRNRCTIKINIGLVLEMHF